MDSYQCIINSNVVPKQAISLSDLQQICQTQNLSLVGVADLSFLTKRKTAFVEWQNNHSADLHYMQRDSESYFSPAKLFAEYKSLIVVAAFYESAPVSERPAGFGRIARYAWGRDYHKRLKKSLDKVARLLADNIPNFNYKIFTDAVPLLERALAESAGIGFTGKNSMLIRPRQGSFFLLAELLCNVDLEANLTQDQNSCGSCSRCISNCPTNAIVEPYVVDAKRCISYLTIEKRGMLLPNERTALGEWLFGCDICQEICPFNHRAQHHQAPKVYPDFDRELGCGPFINLKQVLEIKSQEQYLTHFAGSALMRAKRQGLVRNAICVAHNTSACDLIETLQQLAHNDADEVVRAHAYWAVLEMGHSTQEFSLARLRQIIDQALCDASEVVQSEGKRFGSQKS